jgi:hypothetical protein
MKLKFWDKETKTPVPTYETVKKEAMPLKTKRRTIKSVRKKDTVAIFEVLGRNIDLLFLETDENRIKIKNQFRPLPDDGYYLTGAKQLEQIDLKTPLRAYIVDGDIPKNLTLNSNGDPPKYTSSTLDLLIEGKLFDAMFKGLAISRTQAFLYGCAGVVIFQILKAIGNAIFLTLTT